MKKTKKSVDKKTRTEAEYQELREATTALASCAVFALQFDKHLGRGSGLVINLKTGKNVGPWQDKFFDALEKVGIKYDREAYYKSKAHRRRA
jgi:hypothetical protein